MENSILSRDFYNRPPEAVAQDLLGKIIVREGGDQTYVAKIIETEAYLSSGDTACHATRGQTDRNKVMFGEAGHAYIYLIYGMYHCLNFVTEGEGQPSAVLIRAVRPLHPDLSGQKMAEQRREVAGPGRLSRWLNITKDQNEIDITQKGPLYVADSVTVAGQTFKASSYKKSDLVATGRVGVDYSEHAHLPLRFYVKDESLVSKKS